MSPRAAMSVRAGAVALLVTLGGCGRSRQPEERAAPVAHPAITYGAAMADVGRRFEVFGRAANAGRFELAAYELGELDEAFTEILPHAAPPREGHPEVLSPQGATFATKTLADLAASLGTRDQAQVTAAFARAAAACNACHLASGHAFIDIPTVPGRAIPNTDPLATAP
jgi:hypothetical protein